MTKFKEIRNFYRVGLEAGLSEDEVREVLEVFSQEARPTSLYFGNILVIPEDNAVPALAEELDEDNYRVAFCAPWALADASGLSTSLFAEMQGAGLMDGIAEIMENHRTKLAETIFANDGWIAFGDIDYLEVKFPGRSEYVMFCRR